MKIPKNIQKHIETHNIEFIDEYKGTKHHICCKCHCGEIFHLSQARKILNRTSCGCDKFLYYFNKLKEKNIELLTSKIKCNTDIVECKCFCGNIFQTKLIYILSDSSSCGCMVYQYNKGNTSYKWNGVGEISGSKWSTIKTNAKNRKVDFSITKEYAWEIFIKQQGLCVYTDLPLFFGKSTKDRSLTTASLDRIDSNKGYVQDNIQWIHKDVNSMKWDFNDTYFKKLCFLVNSPQKYIDTNQSCVVIEHMHNFGGYGNIGSSYWNRCIKIASQRNLLFEIDIEHAWNMFLEQRGYCVLTGLPIEFGYREKQTASLDRIDSNVGYITGNVQWVHKDINVRLKRNINEQRLKELCNLITEKHYEN